VVRQKIVTNLFLLVQQSFSVKNTYTIKLRIYSTARLLGRGQMATILAIDAAWTNTEPSGVAVVQGDADQWCCIAVAPSYQAFLGLANGTAIDWDRRRFEGTPPDVCGLLEAAKKIAKSAVDLVTVDIPLATVPIVGRREADQAISREFGARLCAAHTPGQLRPGPLGASLLDAFIAAGFPLKTRTRPNELLDTPALIEVYPHPSLLSLLNVHQRVPYKVSKSGKYWRGTPIRQRIENLLAQFAIIHVALAEFFGVLPVQMPTQASVQNLTSLKRYEDALDAIVCAWVGTQFLSGVTSALGDATAAIWVPQNVILG
jgi:predicted RNase H-like nuclease